MADYMVLLKLVLDGRVQVKVMVAWLAQKLLKEATPEILSTSDKFRANFVNFFLLFLREQAAMQVQDLQHSGLTPQKSVGWAAVRHSDAEGTERTSHKPTLSSRMRLIFTHSQYSANSSICSIEGTASASACNSDCILTSYSRKSHRGSYNPQLGHRSDSEPQSNNLTMQKSFHKPSLGQFITNAVGATLSDRQNLHFRNRNGHHKQSTIPLEMVKFMEGTEEKRILNFKDQELFPPIDELPSIQRKQVPRRITPTPVIHCKGCLPGVSSVLSDFDDNADISNTVFTNCPVDEQIGNFQQERELLKQERVKRQQCTADVPNSVCESAFSSHSRSSLAADWNTTGIAVVCPDQVQFKMAVITLAELYSACIAANLVPCLMAELYFLIQLLTVHANGCVHEDRDDIGVDRFLCNAANCVQFAVHVLWLQRRILSLLDRGTLRLLQENPRLRSFSPKLCQFLNEACKKAPSNLPISSLIASLPSLESVSFQHDTDNRNNFVNDQEFHNFRRKRDLFYELLREWEANHALLGWSAIAALSGRVKSLVTFGRDTASCSHLARLFQAQLMSMCKGDVLLTSCDAADGPEILSVLKQTNPEKYKRLQERFVTPHQLRGPCPFPTFPGHQEFFRLFIVIAESHTFNHHLIDGFSAKIHEMNSFQLNLVGDGVWNESQNIDNDVREQFLSYLLTLRLLAKFLGYVVFLPYQTNEQFPETIQSSQLLLRNHNRPIIDIFHYLQSAIRCKRTILVFPWLVEFLSMMDPVAPLLPYYRRVLFALFAYYRSDCLALHHSGTVYNRLFLLLLLGWLFEIVNFKKPLTSDDEATSVNWEDIAKEHLPSFTDALDLFALIDQRILYTCCPYLGELRILLVEFSIGTSSKSSLVKKIKPISTENSATTVLSSKQIELEENFFHNHPVSLRRTVEFITDRMSSNIIKHARHTIIPRFRQTMSDNVKSLAASLENVNDGEASEKWKLAAAKQVAHLSQTMAERVRNDTVAFAKKYCPPKCSIVIPILLPDETAAGIVDICIKIVHRATLKKVLHWTATHITADVFHQELLHELQKLIHASTQHLANSSQSYCPLLVAKTHNKEVPSPADVLVSAKRLLVDLFSQSELDPTFAEKISNHMQATQDVITSRQDLTSLVYRMLLQLSVDLAIGLLIRLPGEMDDAHQVIYVTFWQSHASGIPDLIQTLFCGRNFQLLQSNSSELSWCILKSFVFKLINAGLILVPVLGERFMSLLKLEWSQDFIMELMKCLTIIVNGCPQQDNAALQQLNGILKIVSQKCESD